MDRKISNRSKALTEEKRISMKLKQGTHLNSLPRLSRQKESRQRLDCCTKTSKNGMIWMIVSRLQENTNSSF
mgnify:CR=1 FL=1|jgi:hypothetical protein